MTLNLHGILLQGVPMELTEEIVDKKEIKMNSDFLEEIQFKPINKGLGFHQDRRSQTVSYPRKIQRPLMENSFNFNKKRSMSPNGFKASEMTSFSDGPEMLSPAIGPPLQEIDAQLIVKTNENVAIKSRGIPATQAANYLRIFAFAVDFSILAFFYFFCAIFLMLVLELNFNKIVDGVGTDYFIFINILLFSFMYIFYFSILDIDQTIGKSFLKLRVKDINQQRVDLKATFLRSVITLFSFPLLGLPLFLDFQSRITETVVAAEK